MLDGCFVVGAVVAVVTVVVRCLAGWAAAAGYAPAGYAAVGYAVAVLVAAGFAAVNCCWILTILSRPHRRCCVAVSVVDGGLVVNRTCSPALSP